MKVTEVIETFYFFKKLFNQCNAAISFSIMRYYNHSIFKKYML